MNGSKCVVACAGDKHLYTVLEQQQAQIAQGNLMGSDHTYVIPQAAAGAAAVERRPQGGAAKRRVPFLQMSCCSCVSLLCCGLCNIVLSWPIKCPFAMACVLFMCHGQLLLCYGLFDIQVPWLVYFCCVMACVLFMCHGLLTVHVHEVTCVPGP